MQIHLQTNKNMYKKQVHCGKWRASVPRNIASASSAGDSHDASAAADDDNLTADDNHDQS